MVTSTQPAVATVASAAQPLPTAATLAADCAALIAELQSAQARLQLMDVANGAFHPPVKRKRGAKAAKAPAASSDFVKELATRFARIDDRLNQTARKVRDLEARGIVASGFPSGRSKVPTP